MTTVQLTQGIENGAFFVKFYSSDLSGSDQSISLRASYISSSLVYSQFRFTGPSSVIANSSSVNNTGTVELSGRFTSTAPAGTPFFTMLFAGTGAGSFDFTLSTILIDGAVPQFSDLPSTAYDIPIASDSQTITLNEDGAFTGQYDPFNSLFGYTLSVRQQPSHGSVQIVGPASILGDPSWRYTPAQNYFGADTFLITATEGLKTRTVAVDATVLPVRDDLVLNGSAASDVLRGDLIDIGSHDRLSALGGDDSLEGGAGDDTLDGGEGDDLAAYDSATGDIFASLLNGTTAGAAGVDTLLNIENLRGGSFNDTLEGNNDSNAIDGGSGDDRLNGRGGVDWLDGGAGHDVAEYSDDAMGVEVSLDGWVGNEGGLPAGWTGSARDGEGHIDLLRKLEAIRGTGFADHLRGNGGDNRLDGRGGFDTLDGGEGSDWAEYSAATQDVQVDLALGFAFDDGQQAGDGAAGSPAVRDVLISIENVLGGLGNDRLAGSAVANVLDGGPGGDTLMGGAGDDQLIGGAGVDTAVYTSKHSEYAVVLTSTGLQVSHVGGGDGVDNLVGVEQLLFADGAAALPKLSLALRSDTGMSNADGLTNDGTVLIGGLADGVAWQYTFDGGLVWQAGTGLSFMLEPGDHAMGDVRVRLSDQPGMNATLAHSVSVDTDEPRVITLSAITTMPLGVGETATLNLIFSSAATGFSAADFVDSKGGSISDLASSDGGTTWTMLFTPNDDRLGPAGIQFRGAYADVAGNAGSASGTLAISYAATATASDGYISGGNIYLDLDDSGTINGPDILKSQTGSDGSVAITLAASEDEHNLLFSGGIDISTGQAFTGLMKAPAGSTMLSPLTTLLVDLVHSDTASSVADAQAKLGAALVLPTGVDLTSYDPLEVVVTQAATSTAEEKTVALQVQAKTLAVANLLVTGAAALQGAAASGTPLSAEVAYGAVLSALLGQIGSAGTVVDLTNAGTLSMVLGNAAAGSAIAGSLDAARQSAAVSVASSVLAAANQAIESATNAAAAATSTADLFASLSTAVAVQSVVQGDVGAQLAAGQTAGLPTDRDELAKLTQQLDMTQLQLTVDQTATADTTPPPTPNLALAVDTGSNSSDGISTNGAVRVSGLEAGAVWEYSIDGGTQWRVGNGDSFTLAVGSYAAGQVRARQSDAAGNDSGVGQTAIDLTVQAGVTVELLAYSWKAHTLLPGVQVQAGSLQATTGSHDAAIWEAVTGSSLRITASRAVPLGEAADTALAVNLQDAIAVLRMVVGLEINGAGQPLSPYQAFAADFNADGQVGLSDAIGMLRHVVGLDAPSPQWLLFNQADPTVVARAGLQPGTAPAIELPLSGAEARLGLVGVLRGDVDGSFVGPADAADLDQMQPTYFRDLAIDTHIDLAQFGIYA